MKKMIMMLVLVCLNAVADTKPLDFDEFMRDVDKAPAFQWEPGFPDELHQYVLDHRNTSPSKIEDGLYQVMFPGSLGRGADVNYIPISGGVKDGNLGVTTLTPTSNSIIPIGNHSAPIGSTAIEVYNEKDLDTQIHELSHAYNASLRGNMGGYHFFDEGMAVFVNWTFHVTKMQDDAHGRSMKFICSNMRSGPDLRSYVLDRFNGIPPGCDYPLAGFFMTQVYDICGPKTVKYLVTADQQTDAVEHVYSQILDGARNGKYRLQSEDEFWNLVFSRFQEWTK